MSKGEVKKCPKCGGIMTSGILSITTLIGWQINWRRKVRRPGEKIVAFRCRACGYVELHSVEFPKESVKP
jgi:predicted nucleic-acid-binding Zn-ribbon protein